MKLMNEIKRNTGIHTFELQCRLSYEQFLYIKDALYYLCEDYRKRFFQTNDYYHSYKCALFSDYGIGILLRSRLLKLTVNPSRLMNPDNIIGLLNTKYCAVSMAELYHCLAPYLDGFLPPELFQHLVISRIDYTIDAWLPSDEFVLLMIKLAKKQGLPRGFKNTYTASIRNSEKFNDSYSYDISRSDGSYCIRLYAKHKQLTSGRKDIPEQLLNKTIGLLRAEISCSCYTHITDTSAVSYQLSHENLLKVYHDIFPGVFPYGTYLISSKAKSLLEKYYQNQRTLKKHILAFLNIVTEHHTFHQAYQLFGNKNILKKDLLELFYNTGINPVTIAVNDIITYMPSIYLALGLDDPYMSQELSLILSL